MGASQVVAPKRLTVLAARKAEPREKPYKLAAGGGLYLEVIPTGAKYWRWKYRYGSKEKRIALGVFPEISLARAGELRDEARAQLRNGVDPAAQRKLDKLANHLSAENTFAAIAREWLDTKAGKWVPEHTVKIRAWLENHVFPWIGDKPVAELEAPEVLSMLRRLVTLPSAASL